MIEVDNNIEEIAKSMENTINEASRRPTNKFNYDHFMEIKEKQPREPSIRSIENDVIKNDHDIERHNDKRKSRSLGRLEAEVKEINQVEESAVLVNYDDECGMIGTGKQEAKSRLVTSGISNEDKNKGQESSYESHATSSLTQLNEKPSLTSKKNIKKTSNEFDLKREDQDNEFYSHTSKANSKAIKDLKSEANTLKDQGTISNCSNIMPVTVKGNTSKTTSYKEDKKFIEENFVGDGDKFVFPKNENNNEDKIDGIRRLETINEAGIGQSHEGTVAKPRVSVFTEGSGSERKSPQEPIEVELGGLDLEVAQVVLKEYMQQKAELEVTLDHLNKKIHVLNANKKQPTDKQRSNIMITLNSLPSPEFAGLNNHRLKGNIKFDNKHKELHGYALVKGTHQYKNTEDFIEEESQVSNTKKIRDNELQETQPLLTINEKNVEFSSYNGKYKNDEVPFSSLMFSSQSQSKNFQLASRFTSPTKLDPVSTRFFEKDLSKTFQNNGRPTFKIYPSKNKYPDHCSTSIDTEASTKNRISRFPARSRTTDMRFAQPRDTTQKHVNSKNKTSKISKLFSTYGQFPSSYKPLKTLIKELNSISTGFPNVKKLSAKPKQPPKRMLLRDWAKLTLEDSDDELPTAKYNDSTHAYGMALL